MKFFRQFQSINRNVFELFCSFLYDLYKIYTHKVILKKKNLLNLKTYTKIKTLFQQLSLIDSAVALHFCVLKYRNDYTPIQQ